MAARGNGRRAARWLPRLLPAAVALACLGAFPPSRLERGLVMPPRSATTNAIEGPLWLHDLDAALPLAGSRYQPVFALFTSPDCIWCERLKATVLNQPEVLALLSHFVPVEIDVTRRPQTAAEYQVEGVPAVLILSADGRPRGGFTGFADKARLMDVLKEALNPLLAARPDAAFNDVLSKLDAGGVPVERWPDIARWMSAPEKRKELRERVLRLSPFPRSTVVDLLSHGELAVRLGALEVLEELAGDTFGFDPWHDAETAAANDAALTAWRGWAGRPAEPVKAVFAALTREQIDACLRDLVSGHRERSLRAMRMFEQAGGDAAGALADFLAAHPDLPADARQRVKEARYAILLPALGSAAPAVVAHRLVYGTLDDRIKLIGQLPRADARAVPVLVDLLDDGEAIVREAVVEALVSAARRRAVPVLKRHLAKEKDVEVVHAVLRGLGTVRGKGSLDILLSYLGNENEDLVIAALDSLARLRVKTVSEEIGRCLEDKRWRVCAAALDAAAKLQSGAAGDAIERLLNHPDEFIRAKAVATLAGVKSKAAAPKLEELFLREDGMKSRVIAAFGSMELPLPDRFAKALDGKGPDVLLPVLEALEGCEQSGVAIAARFMKHDNLDVACAAVRLVGAKGADVPAHQAALAGALRGDRRQVVMAALETIRTERDRSMSMLGQMEQSERAAVTNKELDDLFSAFGPPSAGNAPSAATSAPPAGAGMDDLFAAFAETGAVSGAGVAPGSDPFRDMIGEIEARLQNRKEPEMRFAAALLLCRLGKPKGVSPLKEDFVSRTVAQREAIAQALASVRDPGVLPLVRDLLGDPVETVRRQAVEVCLTQFGKKDGVRMLFDELLRPGSPLKPYETHGYRLNSAAESPLARTRLREGVTRILKETKDPNLVVFALTIGEKVWEKADGKAIEPLLAADSPWVRRAAYRALAMHDAEAFESALDRAAGDSSEYVRAVIPAAYSRSDGRWLTYYDAEHVEDEYSSRDRTTRLTEKGKAVLMRLTSDPAPTVRIEAFFSLVSQRESVDLIALVRAIEMLADREAGARRAAEYLTSNYKTLGPEFRVLVPYLDRSGRDDETGEKVRAHFGVNPDSEEEALLYLSRTNAPARLPATFLAEVPSAPAPRADADLRLIYFTTPGCLDCARTEEMLADLRESFPRLRVETFNLNKVQAKRLNEALSERFRVPEPLRLIAPAVFGAGGYVIKADVSFARLAELLTRSAASAPRDWYSIPSEDLARADTAVTSRFHSSFSIGLVAGGGFLDGINPCAFATIIFLLSYLQIARRRPREILWIGLAFVAGVFVAYFGLGLGLAKIVSEARLLRRVGQGLNLAMGILALVVMVLSVRDGILCLRGRMQEMTLQLPSFLKAGIRGVVRRGARSAHFIAAAFAMGVIVSCLELACTGQMYLPIITYMIETGKDVPGAVAYLALYNVAFIVPLLAVFLLAFFGLRAEALTGVMRRHVAFVKFLTAGLMLALLIAFALRQPWWH